MPRTCLACSNPDRAAIDEALAKGEPLREISGKSRISMSALHRHKSHAAKAIVKASERREERLGDSLLNEMRRMNRKAWDLLGKAESEGDYRGAIVGLREARECIEAQDKMLSRAAEAGGNGGPMFQVAIVYGGQSLSHQDAETEPS
jgi:hypothetical protein